MTEVVYNTRYGGFSVSLPVLRKLYQRKPDLFPEYKTGKPLTEKEFLEGTIHRTSVYHVQDPKGIIRFICGYIDQYIDRSDPLLIEIIKEVGLEESSGGSSNLDIETVPEHYEYKIREYDGMEWVVKKLPYRKIFDDLINFYHFGNRDFKCPLTLKILNREIEETVT